MPACSSSWAVSDVTVVLPLVPVMASTHGRVAMWLRRSAQRHGIQVQLAAREQANRLELPVNTGATLAGLRPGERYTACRLWPSTSDAVEGPGDKPHLGQLCLQQSAGAGGLRACRPR